MSLITTECDVNKQNAYLYHILISTAYWLTWPVDSCSRQCQWPLTAPALCEHVLYLNSDGFYAAGPVCNRTWDGWLCWDDTEAGFTSEQYCPDYFQDFDPSGEPASQPHISFNHNSTDLIFTDDALAEMFCDIVLSLCPFKQRKWLKCATRTDSGFVTLRATVFGPIIPSVRCTLRTNWRYTSKPTCLVILTVA